MSLYWKGLLTEFLLSHQLHSLCQFSCSIKNKLGSVCTSTCFPRQSNEEVLADTDFVQFVCFSLPHPDSVLLSLIGSSVTMKLGCCVKHK